MQLLLDQYDVINSHLVVRWVDSLFGDVNNPNALADLRYL